MSAAMQQPDRYAMDGMRALLMRWGSVCELIRGWNGYPTSDPTYRSVYGGGAGTRIPIPDVPSIVLQINYHILRLPDDNANAVTITYAWQLNPGGGWWSLAERAFALGINEHTLRSRERRGRELLIETAGYLMA